MEGPSLACRIVHAHDHDIVIGLALLDRGPGDESAVAREYRAQVASARLGDRLGCPGKGRRIDLEILCPARVASEQEAVGLARSSKRIRDRLVIEGELLPRRAGERA